MKPLNNGQVFEKEELVLRIVEASIVGTRRFESLERNPAVGVGRKGNPARREREREKEYSWHRVRYTRAGERETGRAN